MNIVWSPQAASDLEQQFEYISRDNPQAALEVFFAVKDKIETLVEHPYLGRAGRIPGTRELVIVGTPFLVPYRVVTHKNQIEIIRVFHAAQDYRGE